MSSNSKNYLFRAGAELEFTYACGDGIADLPDDTQREYYNNMYEINAIRTPLMPAAECAKELGRQVAERMRGLPDGVVFGDVRGIYDALSDDEQCTACGAEYDDYEYYGWRIGNTVVFCGCGAIRRHYVHAGIHVHIDASELRKALALANDSRAITCSDTALARKLSRHFEAWILRHDTVTLRQRTSHHVHGGKYRNADRDERQGYDFDYMRKAVYKPVAYRARTNTFELRILDYINIIGGFEHVFDALVAFIEGRSAEGVPFSDATPLPPLHIPAIVKNGGELCAVKPPSTLPPCGEWAVCFSAPRMTQIPIENSLFDIYKEDT